MKNLLIVFVITCIGGISFFIYKDYIYSFYDFEKIINEKSYSPQGLQWKNKSLFYTESSKDRVMKWDGKKHSIFWSKKGCAPASIITNGDKGFMITCHDNNSVVSLSKEGKVLKIYKHNEFKGPNDICSDSKDGFFITSSGSFKVNAPLTGKIFHLGEKLVKKAEKLNFPNGILFDKKKSIILVNEQLAGRVTSFTVKKDGAFDNKKLFLDIEKIHRVKDEKLSGPAGIQMGPERRIYICYYGASRIIVSNIYGDVLNPVKVKSKYVTNCAFNKKGDKMFISAVDDAEKEPFSGKIYQYIK